MKIEEAIEILERKTTIPGDGCTWEQIEEAIDAAVTALRSMQEVREPFHIDRNEWTAEWIYPENEWNLPRCSKCGCNSKDATYGHKNNFCPKCGRAMTKEAWEKLERRLQRMPLPEPPEEG